MSMLTTVWGLFGGGDHRSNRLFHGDDQRGPLAFRSYSTPVHGRSLSGHACPRPFYVGLPCDLTQDIRPNMNCHIDCGFGNLLNV